MRPAASAWERDYTAKMEDVGYVRGKSAPTVFLNSARGVRCVVHGDDFTFLAPRKEKDNIVNSMSAWYDIKVRAVVGNELGEQKEITILNRMLRWSPGEITLEADPVHAQRIVEEMGLEVGSKGLDAPTVKDKAEDPEEQAEDELMDAVEARRFRAVAARANYLGIDRPDVQYAVKEVCRSMAAPRRSCWAKVKRLARYLLEYPRLAWKFRDVGSRIDKVAMHAFGDSDWAGCRSTRRSTSGGMLVVGAGL